MASIKFHGGVNYPLEMHKVRIVQKLNLPPIEYRLKAVNEAGNNTFLLQNADVFMDMLTNSGVNAMSDQQLAAMMVSDDSYAGSATYTRLEAKLRELFGMHWVLPAHQGRACENILSQTFVKPGKIVPMNYHFTTTKAHITLNGGAVEEYVKEEGLQVTSDLPFKGDMDIARLENCVKTKGADQIAFVRVESGTNLIGGQPVSIANLEEVRKVCDKYGLILVLDASLLADNLYFNKTREEAARTSASARSRGAPPISATSFTSPPASSAACAAARYACGAKKFTSACAASFLCTKASSPMAACRCAKSRR